MTSKPTYRLVRQASAAKLGATSAGLIHYAVLIDPEHGQAHLALTGNDSGGYFSREAVAIEALRRCAQAHDPDKPLLAGAFKPAYVGLSTNNAPFISACLCAEGLLNRLPKEAPGRGQPLADAGYWDDWCAQVRAQATEQGDALPVFHIGKPPAEPVQADETAAHDTGQETADTDPAGELAQTPAQADADADSDAAPADKPRRRGKGR